MQRNLAALPYPAVAIDVETALAPVNDRIAQLLRPAKSIPRYGNHGFDGVTEVWEPRDVTANDVPALSRQLALVEDAMTPGESGVILARVHALLAQYRDRDPLPPQVEAAVAEDWLDDIGEYPAHIVAEACRRWRRHPTKYRFKPLPGDIRAICNELLGQLPVVAGRLRRLLASVPRVSIPDQGRAADIRARVTALVAAKRIS